MPYATNSELPARIREILPTRAQDVYRAAFNDAYTRYGALHEELAHRLAWHAVKRQYVHVAAVIWIPRSERRRGEPRA